MRTPIINSDFLVWSKTLELVSDPVARYILSRRIAADLAGRGIEVNFKGKPYPVNFEQQNEIIRILNRSILVGGKQKITRKDAPEVESIIIYHFDDHETILSPYSYVDDNLIYSAPAWTMQGLLMEVSAGELRELLKETHD